MISRLHLAFGILVCSLSVGAAEEPARLPSGAEEPGWEWILPPAPLEDDVSQEGRDGVVLQLERRPDELVATYSYVVSESSPGRYVEWHPVALDQSGKRVAFRPDTARGNRIPGRDEFVWLQRWTLAAKVVPLENVASVGIEGLTREGFTLRTRKRSALALVEAQQLGILALPLPEIGQPFEFELQDVDGKPIRSRDYKGKVLVIDCWATWCTPCMRALPEVKTLYDKWHEQGLEVIGINFDDADETCLAACERLALLWPQVRVDEHQERRNIWQRAAGISALPRILVVNRDGTLHADVRPEALAAELERLLLPAPQDSRE